VVPYLLCSVTVAFCYFVFGFYCFFAAAWRNKDVYIIVVVVYQYLPPELGLLQPVINKLDDWCHTLADFPVVTWSNFVEHIRSGVNLLATEDHIRELVNQLVIVGEVGSCVEFLLQVVLLRIGYCNVI